MAPKLSGHTSIFGIFGIIILQFLPERLGTMLELIYRTYPIDNKGGVFSSQTFQAEGKTQEVALLESHFNQNLSGPRQNK